MSPGAHLQKGNATDLECNEVRCYWKKPKGKMPVFSIYNLVPTLQLDCCCGGTG